MSYQRNITYRAGLFDRDNLNSMDNIANSLSLFRATINECNYVQALKASTIFGIAPILSSLYYQVYPFMQTM